MPYPRAAIDYSKCQPDKCSASGTCAAAAVCPQKVLRQEAPNEFPMSRPSKFCRGCAKCNDVCPFKAIRID